MKEYSDITVIIPSYKEVRNISILIKNLKTEFPGVHIYIVDDSPITESNKIKNEIKIYKDLVLISRYKKLGRGSAVIEGIREALKNKPTKFFIEMDSDLAHDPKEIKRFFVKQKKDVYDLIIGSRYLPGGKIKNIEKYRTVLSRVINIFLRIWLGIKVTDFTSGFRMYSRKAVEYLAVEQIESKGFITLSETLFKISNKNLKITEVPITWNYRRYGKSNVNIEELLYSLYFVIRMKIFK